MDQTGGLYILIHQYTRYCTVQYCSAPGTRYSTVQYCINSPGTPVLYCTYCTVLYGLTS